MHEDEESDLNIFTETDEKVVDLMRQLRERDKRIEELEEELSLKDAIITDNCQLIDRLEQNYSDNLSADLVSYSFGKASLGNMSDSTIQYIDSCGNQTTSVNDAKRILEQYEDEHEMRLKLSQQNQELLKQWDDALEYVERVQKQLQAEVRRVGKLKDEIAFLRKKIRDTVIISKSGVQLIAILFILFSLYLYNC
ncbi:unnamed protein product [Anisakis simplex]|uniref:ATG16 domain-containing protein n=1 Tax=Anisakis simplex TaxID=6269 RepID=A0A0M3JW37_ANISI|nr:unnamed protein product [Anisakis simplex]